MRRPLPPLVAARVRALHERPIEPTEKGFGWPAAELTGPGPGGAGLTAARLAAARPPVRAAGLGYPLLTLRETALAANISAMAAFCDQAGVALAPHGKTAMSPELAARQLIAGAWGITVATIGQLRTYRQFGFPRLLLANELVDEAGIAWLAGELAADPGFEAYCYVDSIEGVAVLDHVLAGRWAGRVPRGRLGVLVEIGQDGGRTGCRTDADALAVARAAAAAGTLTLAGVAGYEGTIGADGREQTLELVAAFCARLRALAEAVAGLGPGAPPIATAGGSAFFDVVAAELTAGTPGAVTAVVRSGAYLTHDHGLYRAISPGARGVRPAPALRPALELWAQVLSRPEPALALLGAGRRDVGSDAGLPVPLRVIRRDGRSAAAGGEVTGLNDQHAYLRLDPAAELAPGDLVTLGISHPCTTLDKWRVIPVLDDEDRVIDAVHTFF